MDSALIKKFLHYYTPKFFATEGLKRSVHDQKFANDDHAMQYHDLVLLQGSRKAILSMTMGGRRTMYGPEVLSNISAPTLVLHGEEDKIAEFKRSFVFKENIENSDSFFIRKGNGSFLFDLRAFVTKKLNKNGVLQVDNINLDSFTMTDEYFSHRRAKKLGENYYGRCISVIMKTNTQN